ncbi:helix-turn-helix transcriptional regulator [Aneurinibacillus aneurinilyticus]|uniref:helix-turn-helix domain-containing protein n=1 Tax=Aneurinibacillus aneurinilyticus TaxID=1391 RepID=UPI002E24995D|nr:helix-turn-helix transcriptional regulator [Aneurinibacillus aneurinilyticus]MED0726512.1 helix-turn-helix transcriptional regulator [Aneurinibacillus aneurinilyticus]
MEDINLGQRIRNIREKSGLSARKLALLLDIDPSMISKIENGHNNPSLDLLIKICNVLGVPLVEVFINDDIEPLQENILDSLVILKSLTEEEKNLLLGFINRYGIRILELLKKNKSKGFDNLMSTLIKIDKLDTKDKSVFLYLLEKMN